jgi:hypothetical protein
MSEDEVVKNFEAAVNELKEPFLNATSVSSGGDKEQDVAEVLSGVEQNLDNLHGAIHGLIEEQSGQSGHVKVGGGLDKHSLYQIFDRKNIFTALKRNPELKERLLRSLHILLKEYPFTRSLEHVHVLRGTPSYQIKIIPNKV